MRYLSPFLKIGATFACLQSFGTIPDSKDDWKSRVKAGANSRASSFSSRGLILSGPGDFVWSRFFSKLATPSSIMGIVSRGGVDLGGGWGRGRFYFQIQQRHIQY